MTENNEKKKSITYIKNGKHLFNIIKLTPLSPTNIEKIGVTIYKKTLEINILNKDSIDLALNTNSNFEESCCNIGFMNIHGVLCFMYASMDDIKELHKKHLNEKNNPPYKICRIENIHCFTISYCVPQNIKKLIKKEFEKIGKFLVGEELCFCRAPFRFDDNIPNQLKSFEDNCFKYKLYEKYMYNENFSPQICRKFLTPIVKAFYKHITYNNLFNDKDNINVAIRYKLYDDKKYLIEVELFITPTTNQRMFQNIFYVYYNECSDKMDLLKKILENWHNNTNDINTLNNMLTNTNNKIKNEGLIINFYQNDNDNQLFLDGISNLKEFEIINIIKNSEKNIESNLNENMDKLKSVGYNFKYNDVEYNSQNKLLILTGDNYEYLFSMIKYVSNIMYSIFMTDRGFQKTIINNAKEEIFKYFKSFEKKIKKVNSLFPERPEVKIIKDEKDLKNIIQLDSNNESNNNMENNIKNANDENCDNNNLYENIDDKDVKKINKIENLNDLYEEGYNDDNEINDNININQIENNAIKKVQKKIQNINKNNITIFIGTFNVNALESELIKKINLDQFLFPEQLNQYFTQDYYPTFYCIGLEETIELNPKNVLIKPKNKAEQWEERISMELQEKYNYFLQCKEQLVGVLLLFYIKSMEIKHVKNIHVEKLKSGFMGCGNKGCCFLDFEYKKKTYGFCSCHLPAGQNKKNYLDRKETFKNILEFKVNKNVNEFHKNNFFFIFGDLNFRTKKMGIINLINHLRSIIYENSKNKNRFSLDINHKQIDKKKKMSTKNFFKQLSEYKFGSKLPSDISNSENYNSHQSSKSRENDKEIDEDYNNYYTNNDKNEKISMDENIFQQYFFNDFLQEEELKTFKEKELNMYNIDEAEITFPPTYKFIKGTNFYNLSKRVPSWTDRILFKKGKKITPIFYERICINFSDHKPIVGLYEINLEEEDE